MEGGFVGPVQRYILQNRRSLCIVFLMSFVLFFEPECVGACAPALSTFLSILKLLDFALLALLNVTLLFLGRRDHIGLLGCIMLLHAYLVIVTFFQGGRLSDSIKVMASVGAVFLVIRVAALTGTLPLFMRIGRAYFIIIALANLISVIVFPNGLYFEYDLGLSEHLNSQSAEANAVRYFCGHKNSMLIALFPGVVCAGLTALTDEKRRDFYLGLAYIGVLIASTAMADAVTSAAVGVLLLIVFIILHRKAIGVRQTLTAGLILAVDIAIVHFRILDLFSQSLRSLNRNTTLSGRTYIWDGAVKAIGDNWLFGHGIQAPDLLKETFVGFSHPHNVFLATLYYGGIIGLAMFLFSFYIAFRNVRSPEKAGAFLFYSTAALMLMGVVEPLGIGLSQLVFPLSIAYFFGTDVA